MQTHKNNNGFTDRLAACVERVGGKRAMATNALISEAQLFRYLNGESDVPSDRLVAIAKASGVDAGWLLTGGGDLAGPSHDKRPAFRGELMVQVVHLLEELLVEFEKPFNPKQRARAITFLYNALRHEEVMRQTTYQLTKFDILRSLNYLAELRNEEELTLLNDALTLLEYSGDVKDFDNTQRETLRMWTNLVVRGTKGYYSSYPGQVYYERTTGGQLNPSAILELQNLVTQACTATGKTQLDWLDLGCGGGRHLMHLANHTPNISIKGVELSQLGYSMCKDLMDSEKLPKDSVIMADMRHVPYGSQSFDVIYANLSLYCLPFVPGTGLGLEEAFAEIVRMLRPKGLIKMIFPMGNWRDYSMSYQYMDQAGLNQLIKEYPLEIISFEVEKDEQPQEGNKSVNTIRINHHTYMNVTLQKK